MKKALFLSSILLFTGCSVVQKTTKNVQNFSKCYIHKIPAPFWVCYQSSFLGVGKVNSEKFSRIKQEEAYSQGISSLIATLQGKTSLMLRKLNTKKKISDKILKDIKKFIIVNANEGKYWYDKSNHILYVQAYVNANDFKNFLFKELKTDKKRFEKLYNETF